MLDLVGESTIASVALPSGANPWTAEILDTRVFVTALLGNVVYEVNAWTGSVVDTAAVGKAPEGMAVANGKLYVANTGFDFGDFSYEPGTVSVLDASDLSAITTIDVGLNPQECLVTPDGRVHVICTGDFWMTTGVVHVIDPATDAVVDSLAMDGYPGGGAAFADGSVHLNVTTASFSSEIRSYDASTMLWTHDGNDPLLPSFDFYGNVRVDGVGRVLVPDFTQDLLLVENPVIPGAPEAHLVGDGPIDLAVVEREETVPLLISGLSAVEHAGVVRLEWRSTPEAGVAMFVVDRRPSGGTFARAASGIAPARRVVWEDDTPAPGAVTVYRVGAVDVRGRIQWSSPVSVSRAAGGGERLAITRAYPNPFRTQIALDVFVPGTGEAHLEVVDVRGRRVTARALGAMFEGRAVIEWNGRDDAGRLVAPGVYFVRIRVGNESVVTRAMRLR